MLFGMAGRVDLELASVILEEWLPQAQRWRAQVVSTGERIQVRPAKLKTALKRAGRRCGCRCGCCSQGACRRRLVSGLPQR